MLTLVAKLSPLREVVGALVKDVDLAIRSIGPHYVLLDRLANSDLLDQVVHGRQRLLPLLGRNDLDDAGFHTVPVDLFHKEFEILELLHRRLEHGHSAGPVVGKHLANVFDLGLWLGLGLGLRLGLDQRFILEFGLKLAIQLAGDFIEVAQLRVAAVDVNGIVAVGRRVQGDRLGAVGR